MTLLPAGVTTKPDTVSTVLVLSFQVAQEPRQRVERPVQDGTSITIGRLPTCQVVVHDPTISRQHARIDIRGGRCVLSDLGSTSGTRIHGERITAECHLRHGDCFSVGAVMFSVEIIDRPAVDVAEDHADEAWGTIARRVDLPAPARPSSGAEDEAPRLVRLMAEISQTLVAARELPDVLEKVVQLVFDAVSGERVYLMLRDSAYDALTPRVARLADGTRLTDVRLSRTIVSTVMRERVAMLAADALNDDRLDLANSIASLNIRSFMCAPLWNRNEVIGVLYVDNPRSRKFTENDLTVLVALSNYAAVAIEQARLAERVVAEQQRRERLQRYHSPAVVNRIVHGDSAAETLEAHVREVTVMFTDLVGFTAMSEKMEPRDVAATLNEFFREMTDVIFDHQGTLDKFIGDAILAVFGAPLADPDHARNAVRAAVAMQHALAAINAQHPERQLRMRIAVNSGPALVGDIGSPRRREFTVLGDTVNTASRLESSVTKPGQIVISRETWRRIGPGFRTTSLGEFTLRGRESAIEAFSVDI